ncbi:MAG: trypsin-like peptidase domain-containing protein [Candidatus Micrarchaeota archaeon]
MVIPMAKSKEAVMPAEPGLISRLSAAMSAGKNSRLMLIIGVALVVVLLFAGGMMLYVSDVDIKAQEGIISSNMSGAEKLLNFEEQADLSLAPAYQDYSNEIGAACVKLDALDKDKTRRSADAKLVCENKKGLDNCFFQLEKIKTQIRDNDSDINLDSLDVLCSDLRSMGMQDKLVNFTSQYEGYSGWLKGEKEIMADWNSLTALFSNTSSDTQLSNAKLSDYYTDYRNHMTTAKNSLQDIKSKCALKNGYETTNAVAERVCGNVDEYLADVDKVNAVVLDTFNFFSKLEVGTVSIDALFIRDCNQVGGDFFELYDLKFMKDVTGSGSQTDLTSMCGEFENLSIMYGSLGIPLILEDGELSSITKTELFKAKTVYVETDGAIGSGVIVSSDQSGYYILTNAHVALTYDPETGTEYLPRYARIKFYDGKFGYAAHLGYTKEGYDLALLYVPSSGSYPEASFYEDYYPNAGDKVIAVGNPYGLQFSTTQGTVSGIRDLGCLADYCYGVVIQTDTAINAGNSGGGLWNYDTGELVGINSLGLTQAEGISFAISMYQYGKIKDTFEWYDIK